MTHANRHPNLVRVTLFLGCSAFGSLGAQTAATDPSAPPRPDAAIVLSPFMVEAGTERGYLATQTLSGTRLKTDLKDIGSAMTVFTEQLMDDLGANSIYDLMAFAPNTDPFIMSTSDITGNGNDFINIPTKFVSRGGASTVVGQDFFTNNIPNDRFNSEALTFTRGPNAILFGLGNAAGAFVSSTKRAKNRTATTIEYQVDDRGSYRATLDHNHVLKKDLLAIRYSGLYENLNSFRIPTESFQRRHFVTLNLTPFKTTTLRVNYERGLINAPAVRPWPDYDAVSPWLAAGTPIIETFTNTAAGKPRGIQNYGQAGLVSTAFSAGGTPIPTQSLTNQGQSVPTSFANGFAVNGASFRSLVNEDIYPTFASNFGNSAFRLTDYDIASLFIERQITRDFFVEAAYNRVDSDLKAVNGFVGQLTYIYVDPNRRLPNGQLNPNVGLLYSESQSTLIDAPNEAENYRVMASYNLDFTRRSPGWLRHLGRHQAAVFMEDSNTSGWSSNNGLFNSTPLAATGAAAQINNGNNAIRFRYYMEPARGKIGTNVGDYIKSLPVLYANDPLPARDASGVTPAFFSFQGPTMTESVVRTYALATQSFFWKDRIVVTNGLREDKQTSWLAVPNDFAALRDARGIAPRPSGIDLRRFKGDSRTSRGGNTYSRGLVFHALPWLSLSYNTSNNFQVNAGTRNVYGDLLPNPEGEGTDYGVKLSFLNRRVFLELTHYTNSNQNSGDSISNNSAGNFKQFDQLWIGVSDFTGDVKYLTSPYSTISTVWQDVVSTTSKGYEFSLTANPTDRWRITLNGSRRGDNTTSARGVYINQYMAEYIPIIKAHPEWLPVVTANNLTVAQRVAELEEILVNFNAIRNSPSANFASRWTLNLIQSYDFARTGPLGGFSIGGSMNARGKAISGFAVDARNVLDPTIPYYAPAYANFGAWVTYRRKLFRDRIDWRLQVNVRNVFDKNTIYPLVTVDTRDGRRTPDVAVYTLKEPRTFQFTSTFKF
jgi:outer membrane receptor for ferric coprogen and ferric-rhodotorulic acid